VTITETLAEVRGHLQFADVKTKAARRTLDVPDFLAVMLAQHLAARGVDGRKPDALVFVSAGGGPLRATHFRKRVWAPAAKAASLEGQGLTFHHLRHSASGSLSPSTPRRGSFSGAWDTARSGSPSTSTGASCPRVEESVTDGLTDLFASSRGAGVVQALGGGPAEEMPNPPDQPVQRVEVRGIEPLASTVRLLRSAN